MDLAVALLYLLVGFVGLLVRVSSVLGPTMPTTPPTTTDELPGREPDDRLYEVTRRLPPVIPLGLGPRSRPMYWSRALATTRAGVKHHAPDLPHFRLRHAEMWVGERWPGEQVVWLTPDLVACAADTSGLGEHLARLQPVLPGVAAVLPYRHVSRWIEVSSAGVVLLAEGSLDEAECLEAARALDSLSYVLLRERAGEVPAPLPRPAVARAEGPTRCAYCHDALDAQPIRCPGCATALHPECLTELLRCPTAGCEPGRVAA